MGPSSGKVEEKGWLCEGVLEEDALSEPRKGTVHTITVPPRRGQRLHHPHDRHFIPEEEQSVKGK